MKNSINHTTNYTYSIYNVTLIFDKNLTSSHYHAVQVPLPLYVMFMVFTAIVGAIGNLLVLFVILRMRGSKSYTNLMILNLTVSDLAVTLFCIPFDIPLLVEGKWIYGKMFCSLYYPIGSAQLFSSVFTLVNITYVRFYAICYPFKEQPSIGHAKVMIFVIRLCSTALVVPIVIVLKYDKEKQVCFEDWDEITGRFYTIIVFLLGYAIPLATITIGYCRIVQERWIKKDIEGCLQNEYTLKENWMLVKLSVAVTVTFGLCVLPNQLVFLLYNFANLEKYQHHLDLLMGSHMLLFLYCAINPMIYNRFSEQSRRGVHSLIQGITENFRLTVRTSRRYTMNSL